ncbi:MAG: hypothetical protein ACLTBR_02885 [Anaerostipes sp.]|uniref:hypothetical protein n=1 Tax=Anaerostipes sp. TaxID=1872530 RepID=UPI0039954340
MIITTKQEVIKKHRDMWNWIAGETEATGDLINEGDYFDEMRIPDGDRPKCNCYCCKYVEQKNDARYRINCKYCPLDWKSDCDEYMCLDKERVGDSSGLFSRWSDTYNIEERAELAREIANLKEVKEIHMPPKSLICRLNDVKLDNVSKLYLMPKHPDDKFFYYIMAKWKNGTHRKIGQIVLDEDYNVYKIFIHDKYIHNKGYKDAYNIVFRSIDDLAFLTEFLGKKMEGE